MAPNMHLEPEPWRRKSPVARHAGKRDRLFSGLPPRRASLFFFRTTIPSGLCARGRGRVLLPEVRFYAWVPQQLPEPEPHRSRGTGATGVRTGVAMVTRARLRWGRAEGWVHVQVLQARWDTDKPPLQRCDGLGRARALGIGADQRPAKEATGGGSGRECVLGFSRLGGSF